MTIMMPDPYPGRCENYRSKLHSDAYHETVRCLEYEGRRHVCQFPAFTHVVSEGGSFSISSSQIIPKPWVKPELE